MPIVLFRTDFTASQVSYLFDGGVGNIPIQFNGSTVPSSYFAGINKSPPAMIKFASSSGTVSKWFVKNAPQDMPIKFASSSGTVSKWFVKNAPQDMPIAFASSSGTVSKWFVKNAPQDMPIAFGRR